MRTIEEIKSDPQPGDTVASDSPTGVRIRTVTSRHSAFVSYVTTASAQSNRTCNLRNWPESLKGWRVVTKKETNGRY